VKVSALIGLRPITTRWRCSTRENSVGAEPLYRWALVKAATLFLALSQNQ